jgi:hypothetical protein
MYISTAMYVQNAEAAMNKEVKKCLLKYTQ